MKARGEDEAPHRRVLEALGHELQAHAGALELVEQDADVVLAAREAIDGERDDDLGFPRRSAERSSSRPSRSSTPPLAASRMRRTTRQRRSAATSSQARSCVSSDVPSRSWASVEASERWWTRAGIEVTAAGQRPRRRSGSLVAHVSAEPEGWCASEVSSQRQSSSQARVRGPAFHLTRIRDGVGSSSVAGRPVGARCCSTRATPVAFAHGTRAAASIVAGREGVP